MLDFIYLLALAAFFVLAWLFVQGCDRIIGPDEAALAESHGQGPEPDLDPEKLAA